MTRTPRIAPPSGRRPHGWGSSRAVNAQKREDNLRRRAGKAYLLLDGTAEAQAAVLDVHHSQISRRRQGQAGLANTLIEIDRLEREGHRTDGHIEAIIETMLEARAARAGSGAVVALDLSREEQVRDGAEDVAQLAYHEDQHRGARAYLDTILHYLAVALPLSMALRRQVAEVGK